MRALDLKVAAARAAGTLSRRTGRGGTSLPGKLLMRLEPHAIGRLAARAAATLRSSALTPRPAAGSSARPGCTAR